MESVKTALQVLELIGQAGEIGVSELARRAGEPKTTVQRNLTTLHEAGWIRSVDSGARRKWTLSAKLVVLAARVEAFPHLREVALPVMEELRHLTQETIHLTLREGGQVVLIERLDSPQALRTVRALGSRAWLHVTANGKAILARLSDAERERYFAQPLKALTSHTLTDLKQLTEQLNTILAQGYAFSDGEMDVNVRSVASSIGPRGGAPVAALSISCPATRLPDDRVVQYGALVKKAAKRIEEQLDAE